MSHPHVLRSVYRVTSIRNFYFLVIGEPPTCRQPIDYSAAILPHHNRRILIAYHELQSMSQRGSAQ